MVNFTGQSIQIGSDGKEIQEQEIGSEVDSRNARACIYAHTQARRGASKAEAAL